MKIERPQARFGYQLALLGFSRFSNTLQLSPLAADIEIRYLPRMLLAIAMSLITAPLRLLEAMIWGQKIAQTRINNSPIFVVGHWRSGTTHLHHLLIQDKAFGYVTMLQAIAPECSLIGGDWLRSSLQQLLPVKRPMDNVRWPLDSPQEEEFALSKMLPWGFYNSLLFPRRIHTFFRKATEIGEGFSPRRTQAFAHAYRKILAVATLRSGGRQLMLKNPMNTARIRLLLHLFPKARFIHIARDPIAVYASTLGFYRDLGSLARFQTLQENDVRESVAKIYEEMMTRYLLDREHIPKGQLVEVRFEDLERDPIGVLSMIYSQLRLPGFESSRDSFERYLETQRSYQKEQHLITDDDRSFVQERWKFAFAALGYAPNSGS